MVRELQQAGRIFVRTPALALLIVATLALGIGANTAAFSIVDGILLRPLPFPEADRLVRLCAVHEAVAGYCVASPPDVMDWSDRAETLRSFGIGRGWPLVLETEAGSEGLAAALVTPGFLEIFGVRPLEGRLFERGDLEQPLAILSHDLWTSRFAGDRDRVGRSVTLDGEAYTVVGVLPDGVAIPELEQTQVWLPLPFDPRDEDNRNWRGFLAVARLEPGVGLEAAQEELAVLAAASAIEHPEVSEGWGATAVSLHETVVGEVSSLLWIFWGAVGFILLIACINIASLLLARSLDRRRELAVRASLGAGRAGLAAKVLAESLVLALAGSVLGTLLAWWAVRVFVALAPDDVPRLSEVRLSVACLAFAIALGVLASVLAGLVPALRLARMDLMTGLRSSGSTSAPRSSLGVRRILVVGEIALALVLLVGAGLLVRSLIAAFEWDGGFEPAGLEVFWLLPSEARYPERAQLVDLYERVEKEVSSLPSVAAATTASAGPLFGGRETVELNVEGGSVEPLVARWYDVGTSVFSTLGVPLVAGRPFERDDRLGAPDVAIVNETLARRLAPDGRVVGKRLRRAGEPDRAWEVVGVAADVEPLDPNAEVEPEIYWPNRQHPRWATYLIVRASGRGAGVAEAVEERLGAIDPDLGVSRKGSLEALVEERLVEPRFLTVVLGLFALIGLVLAVGGTYGLVSQSVASRTREIGVRIALGATRREILGMVLRQGIVLLVLGVGIGLTAAAFLGRLLTAFLYEISPLNPLTYGVVTVCLCLAAALAAYFPATRAARIDPLQAIRVE